MQSCLRFWPAQLLSVTENFSEASITAFENFQFVSKIHCTRFLKWWLFAPASMIVEDAPIFSSLRIVDRVKCCATASLAANVRCLAVWVCWSMLAHRVISFWAQSTLLLHRKTHFLQNKMQTPHNDADNKGEWTIKCFYLHKKIQTDKLSSNFFFFMAAIISNRRSQLGTDRRLKRNYSRPGVSLISCFVFGSGRLLHCGVSVLLIFTFHERRWHMPML